MFKQLFILTLILIGTQALSQQDDQAQKLATSERSFKKQYERNIKKSRINGVYIPANMDEAFEELTALAEKEGVDKFKSAPEEIISTRLHFGLGRWLSVNWNLEEGSRYELYLRNIGLSKVDDMIQFTIVSWHRHLLGKEQEVASRVSKYQEKLKAELESKRQKSEVLYKETRPLKRE